MATMPSVAAAGGGGSKRRRVSDKKVAALSHAIEVQETHQEHKLLLEKAYAILRTKQVSQIRAVIAFMTGSAVTSDDVERLPRGVKILGGKPDSRSVPHYVVTRALATSLHVTEGCVKGYREGSKWLRRLWLAAIGKEEDTEVPRGSMPVDEFLSWYGEQLSAGKVLEDFNKPEDTLELSFMRGDAGIYQFVLSDPSAQNYGYIRNRYTGTAIKLPDACPRIAVSAVPGRFYVSTNWSMREAQLEDTLEDSNTKLWSRFQKPGCIVTLSSSSTASTLNPATASVKVISGVASQSSSFADEEFVPVQDDQPPEQSEEEDVPSSPPP